MRPRTFQEIGCPVDLVPDKYVQIFVLSTLGVAVVLGTLATSTFLGDLGTFGASDLRLRPCGRAPTVYHSNYLQ